MLWFIHGTRHGEGLEQKLPTHLFLVPGLGGEARADLLQALDHARGDGRGKGLAGVGWFRSEGKRPYHAKRRVYLACWVGVYGEGTCRLGGVGIN